MYPIGYITSIQKGEILIGNGKNHYPMGADLKSNEKGSVCMLKKECMESERLFQ